MILTPHIIVGATIGAKTQNLGLIILLGLLSHIILDRLPHWDYVVLKHLNRFKETKKLKHLTPIFLKIAAIDGIFGLLITFLMLWNYDLSNLLIYILIGMFVSLLPDIIMFISWLCPYKGFAKMWINLHRKFHYPKSKQKEGEITFLGIVTQIIVILICVFLLNL